MEYFKLVFLFGFLNNFHWLCNADFSAEDDIKLLDLIRSIENFTSLPKNYPITSNELHNYTQTYFSGQKNEDIYLNGTQLIQKYGYKVEVHHTITSDGYILPIIRIPAKGPATFLMHGLFSSYEDWLTIGPNKCLPFILAKAGRDVWMGNARCNSFAKQNVNFTSSDPKYCDDSWHEIGRLDLPAMIDYVLNTTGQDNLTYIGHSQGTTTFFVLCSELIEYNKKINFMIALSASAWMEHVKSPLSRLLSPFNNLLFIARALGITTIPPTKVTKALTLYFCGNSLLASIVCSNAFYLLFGFGYPQIDYKQLPVIHNHNPSKGPLKALQHYMQLTVSGGFKKFNYGSSLNQKLYGSSTAPSYAVENITVPIAIFYSYKDWFADPKDVQTLYEKLPNVVYYYEVPIYNHVDFLFANNVDKLNAKISQFIEERVPITTYGTVVANSG